MSILPHTNKFLALTFKNYAKTGIKAFWFCLTLFKGRKNKDLKGCQLIAPDKSSLQRKADFFLKSGFQVIAFYILLEEGYLVASVLNFVCKWVRQFWDIKKQCPIGLYFWNIFPTDSLISLWIRGFTTFQSRIPK